MRVDIVFALSLVFGLVKCATLPGKPVVESCRSPEKETFSCRWRPGTDGGLPTTHRLFYTKENSEGTFECPDYRSAGEHSCFFDRNHTSVWVSYWVRVLASNALGDTSSDTLEVDVVNIVQPGPPENVSLVLEVLEGTPYLHVEWRPPAETDVSSGWVTVNYQLRVKAAGQMDWERSVPCVLQEYVAGKQSHFNIHSLHSGERYEVQVRCRLDHGHWSIWSPASSLILPHYALKQRLLWSVVSVVSVVLITAVLCLLIMKRKTLKGWLLPPIPGPKIQGFVSQPLQGRCSGDFLYGLVPQGFPPTQALRDPPEEHLVVCDGREGRAPNGHKSPVRSRILPGFYRLPRLGWEGGPAPEGGSAPGLAHGPLAVEGGASPGLGDSALPGGWNIGAGSVEDLVEDLGPGGPAGPAPPGPRSTAGRGGAAEEEEYSRVSRVRDNVVVLEHQPPRDPSPQPPRDPKQRAAWGSLEGGYVDPSRP
ncbi:prolactin receptor b isoform X2 [Gadus macrocephalus]|uniref:prolactin receptor b isoform X2 n=1 Tax=Gadus macrocephalus TaxID=80720 RepID=UPI0028CB1CE0|nr:prolactin receptor b isoform X2 [Gadus macrocephalus]